MRKLLLTLGWYLGVLTPRQKGELIALRVGGCVEENVKMYVSFCESLQKLETGDLSSKKK